MMGAWDTLLSMPYERYKFAMVVIHEHKLVCAGGCDAGGNTLKSVVLYDFTTETWSPLPDMPTLRSKFGMVVTDDGKLVCAGGEDDEGNILKSVVSYDFTTETWSPLPDMPTPRAYFAFFLAEETLVCAGGMDDEGNILKSVVLYDFTANTWHMSVDISWARRAFKMVVLCDDKLVCAGEQDAGGNTLKSVVSCDFTTETWSPLPDMPTPRSNFGMVVTDDGKLLCAGGEDDEGNILKSVVLYDFTTETWSRLPNMPTPRSNFGMVVTDDGKLVCVGGMDDGDTPLKSMVSYKYGTRPAAHAPATPKPRDGIISLELMSKKVEVVSASLIKNDGDNPMAWLALTSQRESMLGAICKKEHEIQNDMPASLWKYIHELEDALKAHVNVYAYQKVSGNLDKANQMAGDCKVMQHEIAALRWACAENGVGTEPARLVIPPPAAPASPKPWSETFSLEVLKKREEGIAATLTKYTTLQPHQPALPIDQMQALVTKRRSMLAAINRKEEEIQNDMPASLWKYIHGLEDEMNNKVVVLKQQKVLSDDAGATRTIADCNVMRPEITVLREVCAENGFGPEPTRLTISSPTPAACPRVNSKLVFPSFSLELLKKKEEAVSATLTKHVMVPPGSYVVNDEMDELAKQRPILMVAIYKKEREIQNDMPASLWKYIHGLEDVLEAQGSKIAVSADDYKVMQHEIAALRSACTENGFGPEPSRLPVARVPPTLASSSESNLACQAQIYTLQNQVAALQDKLTVAETAVTRLTRRAARQWNIAADDIQVSDQELGRGAFGVVLKARWNGMDVAVKQISGQATADQLAQAKKLLKNEARTLSFVRHTNVMRFYGACTEPPMLVMMAAPNGNLRQLLDSSPKLPALDRFYIARGICSGMVALHTYNILHLDLKPANIMLDDANTPLIADFGLAVMQGGTLSVMMSSAGGASSIGGNRGTEQYKAPELSDDDDDDVPMYARPADVYSYSMLVWELFTGEVPWANKSAGQIIKIHLRANLSGDPNPRRPTLRDTSKDWHNLTAPAIAIVIERCWQHDPTARPPFKEVLHMLDEYARDDNLPALPNAGQLAAAAAQKADVLERQLEQAEAERASAELVATLTTDERRALAADVERLRHARDAAMAERDTNAAVMKSSRAPVEFPAEWTAQNDDGGDRSLYEWWQSGRTLVSLPNADAMWVWVEEKLQESLPNAVLIRLERWENRLQFRDYWTKRENLDVKRGDGGSANEMWLWHGTSRLQPAIALRHEVGLDPRFSSAGFYGRGLYLAEKAQYSNSGYVHCPDYPDTSRRQMLLVRAAIGEPKVYAGTSIDRDLTKPPEEAPGKLFDSVKGGPHRPKTAGRGDNDSAVYVLYDLSQAYPEYIVTYAV